MDDMAKALQPKSDQLNADDLIGQSLTIKITGVKITPDVQQPISISYEGDNGKPYKPCKSMGRVLRTIFGGDGNKWIGKHVTLYRDNNVTWGGVAVGGIRISHVSGIETPYSMALTASKTVRKTYTVQPIIISDKYHFTPEVWKRYTERMDVAQTTAEINAIALEFQDVKDRYFDEDIAKFQAYYRDRLATIKGLNTQEGGSL